MPASEPENQITTIRQSIQNAVKRSNLEADAKGVRRKFENGVPVQATLDTARGLIKVTEHNGTLMIQEPNVETPRTMSSKEWQRWMGEAYGYWLGR